MRPRRYWTPTEELRLRELYPNHPTAHLAKVFRRPTRQIYNKARLLGLYKSAAYLASPAACRLRRGHDVGARTRFPKGHAPANKGLRRPGYAPGRMAETQFKKGHLAGGAQRKWRPIGTEVLDDDGYLKRKVSDDRTKASRFNWRFVHVLVWERHNGSVPRGHAVVFRNGDKADIRIENLELLTRAQLMARNTLHRLPKSLADVMRLRGAVQRQINQKRSRA